jgi:hypothetical protein
VNHQLHIVARGFFSKLLEAGASTEALENTKQNQAAPLPPMATEKIRLTGLQSVVMEMAWPWVPKATCRCAALLLQIAAFDLRGNLIDRILRGWEWYARSWIRARLSSRAYLTSI